MTSCDPDTSISGDAAAAADDDAGDDDAND